ncbi:MAG: hypothetical protein RL368_2120 [Pseudomonadota bacterium]|jgi:4-hydroxybenzoate polyprenyltransferase
MQTKVKPKFARQIILTALATVISVAAYTAAFLSGTPNGTSLLIAVFIGLTVTGVDALGIYMMKRFTSKRGVDSGNPSKSGLNL